MLCRGSIIYLFGCLRVRMFKKRRRRVSENRVKGSGFRSLGVRGSGFRSSGIRNQEFRVKGLED